MAGPFCCGDPWSPDLGCQHARDAQPKHGLNIEVPVGHNCCMAEDEIEKLLREINGNTGQPASSSDVAKGSGKSAARRNEPQAGGGRFAFAAIAGVSLGVAAWFVGLILPFTSAVSAGIGGAFAAFIAAFIAGPPRWFSS